MHQKKGNNIFERLRLKSMRLKFHKFKGQIKQHKLLNMSIINKEDYSVQYFHSTQDKLRRIIKLLSKQFCLNSHSIFNKSSIF